MGYSQADGLKQKFTGYERDTETGLDFAQARYYSAVQGRFTSADEPFVGQYPQDPQSWNLYQYGRNNPLLYVDPTGNDYDIYDKDGNFLRRVKDEELSQLDGNQIESTSQDGNIIYFKDGSQGYFVNIPILQNYIAVQAGPEEVDIEELEELQKQNGSGAGGLVLMAGGVAMIDTPAPGPADLVALGLLGAAAIASLGPAPSPYIHLSESKHNKKVVAGLIEAAATELGKLKNDPPGPGGPRNHHKGEIRAILERAKQIAQRLVGKSRTEAEKAIESIEKEAASQ